MKVQEIDYHRNGIMGLGFYVAIVKDNDREMLVVRFPKTADETTGSVVCAAFDLAQLDRRVIAFGENSWRGYHYADVMDAAIEASHAE